MPLLETAAWPGRPPMWAEGCAGWVYHSPKEGVCRRVVSLWEPLHALGGLLCWRRGVPDGCAIALPRGCAGVDVSEVVCRRGAAVGNRHMPWGASYVCGGCAGGVCHSPAEGRAGGGRRTGAVVGSRRMPWQVYVGGGCAGGCAIAQPRACAGGVPLLKTAA